MAGVVLFDELVLPRNAITDHNTRFSGIDAETLATVTTRIEDVQVISVLCVCLCVRLTLCYATLCVLAHLHACVLAGVFVWVHMCVYERYFLLDLCF